MVLLMVERRPPWWNWVSVCAPIVGYLSGAVVVAVGETFHLWQRGVIFDGPPIMVWTVFCVFGFVAACAALFRKERLWGLTALGIVLNAPALYILFIFVVHNFF
jgi:hypothetical protein